MLRYLWVSDYLCAFLCLSRFSSLLLPLPVSCLDPPHPSGLSAPLGWTSAGQRAGGDWLLPLAAACGGLRVAAICSHCGREREECWGTSRAVGQSRAQVRGGPSRQPLPIPALPGPLREGSVGMKGKESRSSRHGMASLGGHGEEPLLGERICDVGRA